MRMSVRRATTVDIDRVVEVIARTNQLNATRLRLNRADVVGRLNDGNHFAAVVELRDDFGDFGIVGVLIAEQTGKAWDIEELAFSCRAMGRKVEVKTLCLFLKWAQRANAERVSIRYRPSERNGGMRSILEEGGLQPSETDSPDEVLYWISNYDAIREPSAPWLKLETEEAFADGEFNALVAGGRG
jgi:FkbH-like protein